MPVIIDSSPVTQRPADIDGLIDCFLEAASSKAGASVATPSFIPDQRRPGRLEQVSPTLIPLLRGAAQDVDTDPDIDYTTDLAAARGIAVATCLSVPLWALIGLAGWWIWSIL
jgi:hypothetical protein